VTKGPGSKAQGLAMAFKLLEAARARWRAAHGSYLVALVRAGARFDTGCWSSVPRGAGPASRRGRWGRCVSMPDALRRSGVAAVTVGSNAKAETIAMPEARLHDASTIAVEVHGRGPTVLLAVNPRPVQGPQAEELRRWGADPALGRALIDGLSDAFRVVAFDYEGQVLQEPKPDTMTPANVAGDLLAMADAAGADRFAYYGYSWLALAGLQLAIRTDRLAALVMGGFPPLGGPYAQMLQVTTATHAMASSASTPSTATTSQPSEAPAGEPDWSQVEVSLTEAQTRQFVTLYQALQEFDDRAAQAQLTCPRLCFVGAADEITYGQRWGGVHVSLAGPVINRRAELEALGWQVQVLDELDHTQAMQAVHVLPILRPWLIGRLGR
jgi:pimeloyl-ACP methyl ester carboxylesterase